MFSNYLYRRYFTKFWGIGSPQTRFAKRIGFKNEDIMEGFYVADKIFFNNNITVEYDNRTDINILFIGRLAKEKNILRLIKSIETINNKSNSKHRLLIIGEGTELNKILKYKSVKYLGLKSQNEIIEITRKLTELKIALAKADKFMQSAVMVAEDAIIRKKSLCEQLQLLSQTANDVRSKKLLTAVDKHGT